MKGVVINNNAESEMAQEAFWDVLQFVITVLFAVSNEIKFVN